MQLIGEIGLNHMGNYNKAIELIHAARDSGADAVKFQHYYPEILCLNRNNFDAFKVLEKNKLRVSWIPLLKKECDKARVKFLCTAFCKYSVEDIAPYVDMFKIASPEVTDLDFVKTVAEYRKPLVLSTGKAGDAELDRIFDAVMNDIMLLYCVSKYPAQPNEVDLTEMDRLRKRYNCRVGYSDHTQGILKAIEAAEMGAFLIEKHFKVDAQCVDAEVSIFPSEFKKMSEVIRRNYGK